jgi:hypothetical protein
MSELVWHYCCSSNFCIALSPDAPADVIHKVYTTCEKRYKFKLKGISAPKNPPYDVYKLFGHQDTDWYFKVLELPKGDWLAETLKATFIFYCAMLKASSSSPPRKMALALSLACSTLNKFGLYQCGLEKVLPWSKEWAKYKSKGGKCWAYDIEELLKYVEDKTWLRGRR